MSAKVPFAALLAKTVSRLQPAHLTAIIVALLAFAWMASGIFKSADEAVVAAHEAVTSRVRVSTLHSEQHKPTIVLLGRTVAGQAVNVRAEIPGRVLEIVAEALRPARCCCASIPMIAPNVLMKPTLA